jgi:hypothetical protein
MEELAQQIEVMKKNAGVADFAAVIRVTTKVTLVGIDEDEVKGRSLSGHYLVDISDEPGRVIILEPGLYGAAHVLMTVYHQCLVDLKGEIYHIEWPDIKGLVESGYGEYISRSDEFDVVEEEFPWVCD